MKFGSNSPSAFEVARLTSVAGSRENRLSEDLADPFGLCGRDAVREDDVELDDEVTLGFRRRLSRDRHPLSRDPDLLSRLERVSTPARIRHVEVDCPTVEMGQRLGDRAAAGGTGEGIDEGDLEVVHEVVAVALEGRVRLFFEEEDNVLGPAGHLVAGFGEPDLGSGLPARLDRNCRR